MFIFLNAIGRGGTYWIVPVAASLYNQLIITDFLVTLMIGVSNLHKDNPANRQVFVLFQENGKYFSTRKGSRQRKAFCYFNAILCNLVFILFCIM